jgi:hypothetical protein
MGKKGKGKGKGKGKKGKKPKPKSNKRKRRNGGPDRKRQRKNEVKIPFGKQYNYRSEIYEDNLCLYRALKANCDYHDVPIGNSSNVDPVKWIKHLISRGERRDSGEMGHTDDLDNFVTKWRTKGEDIAILIVDEDGDFHYGVVPELYKIEPENITTFVIEYQSRYILHFEPILDEDTTNELISKYMKEDNGFLMWID